MPPCRPDVLPRREGGVCLEPGVGLLPPPPCQAGVKQGCEGLRAPLTQLEKPISFVRVPGVPVQPGWLIRPREEPRVATAHRFQGPASGRLAAALFHHALGAFWHH